MNIRRFRSEGEYELVSWVFMKGLALIYLAAFLSITVQIRGLVGENGILPFQDKLDFVYSSYGADALWKFPNIFWLAATDPMLVFACLAGCLFALFLLFGYKQRISLILLFILYLSITRAGQIFLNFQWDYLLLESGFLGIFLASGPNRILIFLYHWLLFRLRFLSGYSKLASDDPVWADYSALKFYFETQPLPNAISWYAHHLPEWLQRVATSATLGVELIVPFFIFLPRPFRIFAAFVTIVVQLIIMATSNHNWINLLTILLCLFLLDDKFLRKITPSLLWHKRINKKNQPGLLSNSLTGLAALLILYTSLVMGYLMISNNKPEGRLVTVANTIRHYGIGNVYHVFPTMQTERQELVIEGSMDHVNWLSYTFKYKPGATDRRPAFIIPHQPRLDWMIWFVPPQYDRQMYWFDQFMMHLHKGTPVVTELLEINPFPDHPPRYMRVMAYRYHFTGRTEKIQSGHWWSRELLGEFPNTTPRRP